MKKIWNPCTKINKYLALKTIIESNGWCVELFAVEVGARGYCSKSIFCCFKKLCFNNKLIRKTIKKLNKSSMKCSFCVWVARSNKEWILFATNCKLNDSAKETFNSPSSISSLKQITKPVSNTKAIRPVGFINKGNTCYANSFLQILSVMTTLQNQTFYHLCYELSVSTWIEKRIRLNLLTHLTFYGP